MSRAQRIAVLMAVVLVAGMGCRSGRRGGGPVLPVIHEITGNIKVTNDCDGQIGSIQSPVEIWFELVNASGNVGVYAHDTVTLNPDPTAGANPVKIGVYSAQARWAPSGGTPTLWRSPNVMVQPSPRLPTPTPIDLTPWLVCTPIACAPGTGPCKNVAQNAPVAPAAAPFPRAYDIEIVCACN